MQNKFNLDLKLGNNSLPAYNYAQNFNKTSSEAFRRFGYDYPQYEMWIIDSINTSGTYNVRNMDGSSVMKGLRSTSQYASNPARLDYFEIGMLVLVGYYDSDRKKPYIHGIGSTAFGSLGGPIQTNEWMAFMQSPFRKSHLVNTSTFVSNFFGTVVSSNTNHRPVIRIADNHIYTTQRNSGTTRDSIIKLQNKHLQLPTHFWTSGVGIVIEMAFDYTSEEGDLYAIEYEQLGFTHNPQGAYGVATTTVNNTITAWSSRTNAWWGNAPWRSRIIRLDRSTLSLVWAGPWHTQVMLLPCPNLAFSENGVYALSIRAMDGYFYLHLTELNKGTGKFVKNTRLQYDNPPHQLKGVSRATSTNGSELKRWTLPIEDLGNQPYGAVQNTDNNTRISGMETRGSFSSYLGIGPGDIGDSYKLNSSLSHTVLNAPLSGSNNRTYTTDGGGIEYTPDEKKIAANISFRTISTQSPTELSDIMNWICFPKHDVHIPAAHGIQQLCGFSFSGNRKWVVKGWARDIEYTPPGEHEGAIAKEFYTPILGHEDGKLLVFVRVEYLKTFSYNTNGFSYQFEYYDPGFPNDWIVYGPGNHGVPDPNAYHGVKPNPDITVKTYSEMRYVSGFPNPVSGGKLGEVDLTLCVKEEFYYEVFDVKTGESLVRKKTPSPGSLSTKVLIPTGSAFIASWVKDEITPNDPELWPLGGSNPEKPNEGATEVTIGSSPYTYTPYPSLTSKINVREGSPTHFIGMGTYLEKIGTVPSEGTPSLGSAGWRTHIACKTITIEKDYPPLHHPIFASLAGAEGEKIIFAPWWRYTGATNSQEYHKKIDDSLTVSTEYLVDAVFPDAYKRDVVNWVYCYDWELNFQWRHGIGGTPAATSSFSNVIGTTGNEAIVHHRQGNTPFVRKINTTNGAPIYERSFTSSFNRTLDFSATEPSITLFKGMAYDALGSERLWAGSTFCVTADRQFIITFDPD